MSNIYKRQSIVGEKHIRFPLITSTHFLLRSFILSQIGYYPNAYQHYVDRTHGQNEYVYIYCQSGSGTVFVEDNEYHLKRNELICIPKNISHRYFSSNDDPWTIMWIHFDCPLETFALYTNSKHIYHNNLSANRIYNISKYFNELMELSNYELNESQSILMVQILEIILTYSFITDNTLHINQQNQVLSKCINFIEDNYNTLITLETLSNVLELSPSYIITIFKKHLNATPIDYLIQYRIEKACQLLRLSNSKVYEIAHEVGYDNPFYFSRIFKKHMSLSPKEYRDSVHYERI